MLGLDAFMRQFDPGEDTAVVGVEDEVAEGSGSSKEVLGVFSHIDTLAGFFHIKHADSRTVVGVIHAYLAIIRTCEKEITIKVEHDLPDRS
jgi:hypothetical protein